MRPRTHALPPPTPASRQAHLFIVPAFGSLSEAVGSCEGTTHMHRQAEAAAALRASPWFVKWPQRCAPRPSPSLLSLAPEVALAHALLLSLRTLPHTLPHALPGTSYSPRVTPPMTTTRSVRSAPTC